MKISPSEVQLGDVIYVSNGYEQQLEFSVTQVVKNGVDYTLHGVVRDTFDSLTVDHDALLELAVITIDNTDVESVE